MAAPWKSVGPPYRRPLRNRARSAASQEVQDDHDEADDERQVDRPEGHLERETDEPQHDQDDADDGKHARTSSAFKMRRALPLCLPAWRSEERRVGKGSKDRR